MRLFPERVASTPTFPALTITLKLVEFTSPYVTQVLLELLPLHWSLEQVSFV